MNDNKIQLAANAKRKRRRWLPLIRPTLLLLTTVILFTYVSFAWMRREWTPYVEQSNITIATGGSLVFEFEGESGASTGKSINEILGLTQEFVLKPVSSQTGGENSFFTLDLQHGAGLEKYRHLDVSDYDNDPIKMGIENGYIEFQMMLYSPDAADTIRYVYIHPESHIRFSEGGDAEQADAVKCIRMSVTLNSSNETWIFGPDGVISHSGVNMIYDDTNKRYVMDGVNYYSSYNADNVAQSEIMSVWEGHNVVEPSDHFKEISEFDGGTYDENGILISRDTDQTLFSLTSGDNTTKRWVTVRIWAEGSDPNCTDKISGAQIDLKLKFSSFTITN
ncbi:MAG: hypothetical protein IKL59_07935 [Clostridia bacterium]|nr:hypothetical protein [Clostridia bacterium]